MSVEQTHPLPDPAPQARGHRGAGRRGGARARTAVDGAEHRAAAGHEGSRRQVRLRRADPAVRAAERRGDEEGGRAARALPREARPTSPRAASCWPPCTATCTTSARTWSRPSSRNNGYTVFDLGKQVPVQTHPRQGARGERRRDRAVGAAGLDQPADADLRAGAAPRRPRDPGADRRRGDQPQLRPPRRAGGRRGVLRAGRLLLQGRVRGPRHDERARGPGAARRRWSSASSARRSSSRRKARRTRGARGASRARSSATSRSRSRAT